MVRLYRRFLGARSVFGAFPASLLPRRTAARLIDGVQWRYMFVLSPRYIHFSARSYASPATSHASRRRCTAVEHMPGSYRCGSYARSERAFLVPSGTRAFGKRALPPNAPPQLRRHCRARQMWARENCEKRAQVKGRAAASAAGGCSAAGLRKVQSLIVVFVLKSIRGCEMMHFCTPIKINICAFITFVLSPKCVFGYQG